MSDTGLCGPRYGIQGACGRKGGREGRERRARERGHLTCMQGRSTDFFLHGFQQQLLPSVSVPQP